jgi:GH24 family phage-related lysozyme (muramidase)
MKSNKLLRKIKKEHKFMANKTAMKTGTNGIKLIQSYESLRLTAYKAVSTEKYWTIGYGHYGSDVRNGQTITKAKANELFKKDLKQFEAAVNDAVNVTLTQNQFDACVSLAYNIGAGAFQSSTLVKKLNQKDYAGAAEQFLRWNKSGGRVLNGLVKRREAEKELFETAAASTSNAKKSTSTKAYHTVVKGDTVSELAKKYKTTIANIKSLNDLDSKYTIRVGQKLRVR